MLPPSGGSSGGFPPDFTLMAVFASWYCIGCALIISSAVNLFCCRTCAAVCGGNRPVFINGSAVLNSSMDGSGVGRLEFDELAGCPAPRGDPSGACSGTAPNNSAALAGADLEDARLDDCAPFISV